MVVDRPYPINLYKNMNFNDLLQLPLGKSLIQNIMVRDDLRLDGQGQTNEGVQQMNIKF